MMKNRIGLYIFLFITAALFAFSSCVDILHSPQDLLDNLGRSGNSGGFGGFGAPAWINVQQASQTEYRIQWGSVQEVEYYVIERSPPPEPEPSAQQSVAFTLFAQPVMSNIQLQQTNNEDWGEIGRIPGNTPNPSFIDNTTKPGVEYLYRISAYSSKYGSSGSTVTPLPVTLKEIFVTMGASKYAYIEADANDNGVYPVKISWNKPSDDIVVFFEIQRSDGSGFSPIAELDLTAPIDLVDELYYFIDDYESAQVGKKYHYRVCFLNNSKDILSSSDDTGWGALTHERYMIEYNKVMNTALGRLTYMYKTPDTSKIGSETKNGGIGGTIYYKASLVSLGLGGAEILIQLTNYCDFHIEGDPSKDAYFILNGNSDTKSSMAAAGNMRGTMTVTGMYPGTVVYGTVWSTTVNANAGVTIGGGKANGGNYVVTPQGFPDKKVPWNLNGQHEPNGTFMAYSGYNASDKGHLPWFNW